MLGIESNQVRDMAGLQRYSNLDSNYSLVVIIFVLAIALHKIKI